MLALLLFLNFLYFSSVEASKGLKTFKKASNVTAASNLLPRDLFRRQDSDCYWDCGDGGCCPYEDQCCGDGGCAPSGSICCIDQTYCESDESCNSLCGCLDSGWACCGDEGGRYQLSGECCTTTGYWCEEGTHCLGSCDPDTGDDCCSGLQSLSYSIGIPSLTVPPLPSFSDVPGYSPSSSYGAGGGGYSRSYGAGGGGYSSSYHLHTRSTTRTQGTAVTSSPAGGIGAKTYGGPSGWWLMILAIVCGAFAMLL